MEESKTIPYPAARPHIGHIGECFPPPGQVISIRVSDKPRIPLLDQANLTNPLPAGPGGPRGPGGPAWLVHMIQAPWDCEFRLTLPGNMLLMSAILVCYE